MRASGSARTTLYKGPATKHLAGFLMASKKLTRLEHLLPRAQSLTETVIGAPKTRKRFFSQVENGSHVMTDMWSSYNTSSVAGPIFQLWFTYRYGNHVGFLTVAPGQCQSPCVSTSL
jgi:hypothetical protein